MNAKVYMDAARAIVVGNRKGFALTSWINDGGDGLHGYYMDIRRGQTRVARHGCHDTHGFSML